MEPETVSACIIAYNEEKNIRRCLESVKWCDEIIVVDSYSNDRTVEICREYTGNVYVREYKGNIDQKNYAASLATMDWILSLDADERISPEMKREVLEILKKHNTSIVGYFFKRRAYMFGKWIRHSGWYHYKLRFFRRKKGRFSGSEPHDQVEVNGKTAKMKGEIEHFTYDNLQDYIEKTIRYSTVAASKLKLRATALVVFLMLIKPPYKFFECYIIKLGFLDGILGLLISVVSAISIFLKYAYLLDRRINYTEKPE